MADRLFERALRRMVKYLEQSRVDPSGGWLVAVSGGADSMALWRMSAALGRQLGFRVEAAHVDHGLRPQAAAEALLVCGHANQLGTPCHPLQVRVQMRGEGPEAAARSARYAALRELRRELGLGAIALGHTLDDQGETALMRALSGVGLRGLAAMRASSGDLVRPLLWIRRAEALRLARELRLELVDDESNRDRRLLRARLRHDLLPALGAHFGDVPAHFAALAEESAAVDEMVEGLLQGCRPERLSPAQAVGSRPQIAALPPLLRARWLLAALDAIGCSPRRARDSLQRFARLVPGNSSFALDLAGARVSANRAEVRVALRAARQRSGRRPGGG